MFNLETRLLFASALLHAWSPRKVHAIVSFLSFYYLLKKVKLSQRAQRARQSKTEQETARRTRTTTTKKQSEGDEQEEHPLEQEAITKHSAIFMRSS